MRSSAPPAPDRMTAVTGDHEGRVPLAAMAMFMVALVLAAGNGALMKQLAGTLPALTIIWARYLVYLLIMLPFALPYHGLSVFRPPQFGLQALRIVFMLVGTWCFVTGVADMGYADAIAILYIYPFVIIALSPFFLAERVSTAAWLCVATGFAGVLIIMRPTFDVTGLPALFILAAGIILGCHLVMSRILVKARSPLVTSTFTAVGITLITSFAMPFLWQPITLHELGLIIAMGAVSAASQYAMLWAFSRAEAPTLAPFSYTEIPAAAAIGIIAFGERPDAVAWVGIALIIASGVVVARLSHRKLQPTRPRQPVP